MNNNKIKPNNNKNNSTINLPKIPVAIVGQSSDSSSHEPMKINNSNSRTNLSFLPQFQRQQPAWGTVLRKENDMVSDAGAGPFSGGTTEDNNNMTPPVAMVHPPPPTAFSQLSFPAERDISEESEQEQQNAQTRSQRAASTGSETDDVAPFAMKAPATNSAIFVSDSDVRTAPTSIPLPPPSAPMNNGPAASLALSADLLHLLTMSSLETGSLLMCDDEHVTGTATTDRSNER
jgi:hypothetical protein